MILKLCHDLTLKSTLDNYILYLPTSPRVCRQKDRLVLHFETSGLGVVAQSCNANTPEAETREQLYTVCSRIARAMQLSQKTRKNKQQKMCSSYLRDLYGTSFLLVFISLHLNGFSSMFFQLAISEYTWSFWTSSSVNSISHFSFALWSPWLSSSDISFSEGDPGQVHRRKIQSRAFNTHFGEAEYIAHWLSTYSTCTKLSV